MFVDYMFAKGTDLPPMVDGKLYEYVVGANGIFVRAQRPGLAAMIPIAGTASPVRGLAEMKPYVKCERVPMGLMGRIFEKAYRAGGREILFYLGQTDMKWRCLVPEQVQSAVGVRPVDAFVGGMNTVIEMHSHHSMRAFFSSTDNAEEKAGFRVYAVIGDLARQPTILSRIGIFGHFWEIPSTWVFDLPEGVNDALDVDAEIVEDAEYEYA